MPGDAEEEDGMEEKEEEGAPEMLKRRRRRKAIQKQKKNMAMTRSWRRGRGRIGCSGNWRRRRKN